ncbi:MAG: nitrogenase component 1 [Lachnospiraceae bacterium]|nr:nitrogenase component 1 [Lachnospiraceae bacterium]
MKQTFALISTYSSDEFGICSALYELGGMIVIHDASGCNSTYTTHDEPRWYDMDSMVYISALSRNETILGRDSKLLDDILDTARKYKPKFIAIVGAPVPYMIGTDYKAIAKLAEDELNIPAFGFDSNGMQYYTRGMRDAFKAIADRFALTRKTSDVTIDERPIKVNLLGVTPLDFGMTGAADSLKKWLLSRGMECNACFAMGSSLEEISEAGNADVSLVVSYGGTGAAKVLKERFGIPYVFGIPVNAAQISAELRKMSTGNKLGKIALIGEQISGISLAEALKDQGMEARVLCMTDRIRDTKVNEAGIDFRYAPEEDDLIRELSDVDTVIADPLFKGLCKDKNFLELPHMAFSGRMFERDIPDLIGNGDRICRSILNEIKK